MEKPGALRDLRERERDRLLDRDPPPRDRVGHSKIICDRIACKLDLFKFNVPGVDIGQTIFLMPFFLYSLIFCFDELMEFSYIGGFFVFLMKFRHLEVMSSFVTSPPFLLFRCSLMIVVRFTDSGFHFVNFQIQGHKLSLESGSGVHS
jgi:hypothetical protein